MLANEYQKLAMRTNDGKCTERLCEKISEHIEVTEDVCHEILIHNKYIDLGGIINASFGLSGEVGELNDILKKWIFHGHLPDVIAVVKELGDILWYVALMCESLKIPMEEVMGMNIDKLKARYPEGFDPEKSLHRKDGDI